MHLVDAHLHFTEKMSYFKEYKITKDDPNDDIDYLSNKIQSDFPNDPKCEEFNLVYIYSMLNNDRDYYLGKSNIIYIGHTKGEKIDGYQKAFPRFQHCKSNRVLGKRNLSLNKMYEDHTELLLRIYNIKNEYKCSQLENELRYKFLAEHYELPLADGSSVNSTILEFEHSEDDGK